AATRSRRPPRRGTSGHPGHLWAGRPGEAPSPAGAGWAENTHPTEPLMNSGLMFLDCLAYRDPAGAQPRGLPPEVPGRFGMPVTGGPLEGAMIRCPVGHWFTGPIESLTLTTGPGRAAALPCLADQCGGRTERPPWSPAWGRGPGNPRRGTGRCPSAGAPVPAASRARAPQPGSEYARTLETERRHPR